MKKLITGALVLALAMGAAQAQTSTPEKENTHKREHKMNKLDGLNLTEDQKAKLKSLHEEQKKEMQANKSATKEQRMELHKKYQAQMESILTPEQKQQLDNLKEERKASGKKAGFKRGDDFSKKGALDSTRVGRKGNFKRGADFQKELGLTQDQQDRMAKIRTDFRSQFEALRSDKSLTEEQRKSKFRDLMKAQQDQTKSVLSKEQVEKMQSLRKERSAKNTK